MRRLEKRLAIRRFVLGELETNCYLVWEPVSRRAVVIDPGGDISGILAELERRRLELTSIVNTHGHADHILGNAALSGATGAPVAVGAGDAGMLVDPAANLSAWVGAPFASPAPGRLLRQGDEISLGGAILAVRETPGHTPGGIVLVGEGVVFSGDTLFAEGIGRSDLPGGDGGVLLDSIRRQLLSLPDETLVYPGHGPETTIGGERLGNPCL